MFNKARKKPKNVKIQLNGLDISTVVLHIGRYIKTQLKIKKKKMIKLLKTLGIHNSFVCNQDAYHIYSIINMYKVN